MLKRLITALLIPVLLIIFTTCMLEEPANTDPLPLVSPLEIEANYGEEVQMFQLQCDTNPDGTYLYDEDGDPVTVVVDENTPLPGVLTLEATTGIITVTRSASFSGTVTFWTEDDQGGSSEADALTVSFTVTEYDSSNQAPTASFSSYDYVVSGAENSSADQGFSASEDLSNSKIRYKAGNGWELFNFTETTEGFCWAIHSSFPGNSGTWADITYYVYNNGDYPLISGWMNAGSGADPNAMADDTSSTLVMTDVRAIQGNSFNVGDTITGYYDFSDSDGDSEGTSIYQWYRCDGPDSGATQIPITVDGSDIEYLLTGDDINSYMRFEVTPYDEHGKAGIPVRSDASIQIDS